MTSHYDDMAMAEAQEREAAKRNAPTQPPPASDTVAAVQHLETAVYAACNMLAHTDLASAEAASIAGRLSQLGFALESAEASLRLRVLRSKRAIATQKDQ